MALFAPREPKLDFLEKAHLGRLPHFSSDVTVTYDTRSGRYGVLNGVIVPQNAERGLSTTLAVVSDNGHRFTVTRRRGEYETDRWWTWVKVERIRVN